MNRPNDIRGRRIRKILTEMLEGCATENRCIPKHQVIGEIIGISASQVTRHLAKLQSERNDMNLINIGRRVYVVSESCWI